jgi:ABC-type multidrug transport system fused ATPase/permease subunit
MAARHGLVPEVIRHLGSFLRPYPWALPVLGLLGVFASLSEGIGIGLLIPFLQAATGELDSTGLFGRIFGELDAEQRMLVVGGAIIALVLARTVVLYAHVIVSNWLNGRVSQDLRRGVFRQVLGLGHPFIQRRQPSELLNVMDTQLWRTSDAVGYLFTLVANASTIAVFGVMLLVISWQLTIGAAVAVVLASLTIRLLTRRARHLGELSTAANGYLLRHLLDMLNGARMIVAFGREEAETRRFNAATEEVRQSFFRLERVVGLVHPLVEFLYTPLLIVAVLIAVRSGVALPTLIAFLLLVYRLQPHARSLEHNRVLLAGSAAAVAAVKDLVDQDSGARIRSGTRPFAGLREMVRFDQVGFRYRGERAEVLRDVSFEIHRGEVTALVGESGSGKSTIINLLLRFHDPSTGEILVDGVKLGDLDLAAWRGRLAIAGQDAELMTGSIADNIGFGLPEGQADRASIIEAAQQADAASFIAALPQGYDTQVGAGGLSLSGGQRQRISLARALLRRPDILLLDEATNALDGLSETAVQQALARLGGRTAVVVVAHRLSTIQHADRVVVLEAGQVVEQGRPAVLARAGGAFARLYARDLLAPVDPATS